MQSMACKDQRCWNTPQTREGRTHERIAKMKKLREAENLGHNVMIYIKSEMTFVALFD
jgi:hypothetical protein